ncbi:MAG TPA: NfeD family protein [Acidimicrobiales bacterium]|nr:NfeD family protein [Acidimicrobiales bacterium]
MNSPEDWRWIWLIAAVFFTVGEMATPGSFFLFPFAVGAIVAAALAFGGVGVSVEWIAFIAVSIATLAAMRPLARKLDLGGDGHGIGSRRLIGQNATVLDEIPGHGELGMVRVHREEWRAESFDGSPIPTGAVVRVAEIEGTRVIVLPIGEVTPPPPTEPPPPPPQGADS